MGVGVVRPSCGCVIHSASHTTQQQMAITAIRELKVLQKLKHKNIVALKEVVTEGACMPALT